MATIVALATISILTIGIFTYNNWSLSEPLEPARGTYESVEDKSLHAAVSVAELRTDMLDLINAERAAVGLEPLKLGKNTAAQSHANDMLGSCSSAHWGTNGLKPYMRYSLAGGYQYNAENISGLNYCIKPWDNYATTQPKAVVSESMADLMSSLGHRDNILDPHHSWVNIGLAWNDYNMMVVQHFEYDYVLFSKKPSIDDEILSFSVTTKNGAMISGDSSVQILYDPPPHGLTQGQLANTYCYDYGFPVAAIVSPPPPGSYYSDDSYQERSSSKCPDPYHVSPDTPEPKSVEDSIAAHRQALKNSQRTDNTSVWTVPFLVADRWESSQNNLSVTSDISTILSEHGSGAYTVLIWGMAKGGEVIISEYALFYDDASGDVIKFVESYGGDIILAFLPPSNSIEPLSFMVIIYALFKHMKAL